MISERNRTSEENIVFFERRLKEALKRGTADAEAIALFTEWSMRQEKNLEALQKTDAAAFDEGKMLFEIQRAKIYLQAGLKEEAVETLEDLLLLVESYMNEDSKKFVEMYRSIENKIDRIHSR